MKAEANLLEECSELLNKLRDSPENKKCFDCTDCTSPRYVCTNFSTFICSCCANIHKEFGHTIKCLNVFAFNLTEILQLKATGNKVAFDKWLARWTPEAFPEPDPTSVTYKEDAREYFRSKYIEKKWTKVIPPVPHYVSPSKDGASPNNIEERSSGSHWQLHDAKSAVTTSHRAASYPTPPFVYQYMPQHVYAVPMTFPPAQYGYPQYPQVYYQSPPSQALPPPRPRPHSFQIIDRHFLDAYALQYDNEQNFHPFTNNEPPQLPPREGRVMNRSVTHTDGLSQFSLDEPSGSQPDLAQEEHESGVVMIKSASAGSLTCAHETLRKGDGCKACGQVLEKEEGTSQKWKVNTIMSKMAGLLKKSPSAKVISP